MQYYTHTHTEHAQRDKSQPISINAIWHKHQHCSQKEIISEHSWLSNSHFHDVLSQQTHHHLPLSIALLFYCTALVEVGSGGMRWGEGGVARMTINREHKNMLLHCSASEGSVHFILVNKMIAHSHTWAWRTTLKGALTPTVLEKC